MYYFVVYQWKRLSPTSGGPRIENMTLDEHPLDWLEKVRDFEENKDRSRFEYLEEYNLLWFTEISEELFKKYEELGD